MIFVIIVIFVAIVVIFGFEFGWSESGVLCGLIGCVAVVGFILRLVSRCGEGGFAVRVFRFDFVLLF